MAPKIKAEMMSEVESSLPAWLSLDHFVTENARRRSPDLAGTEISMSGDPRPLPGRHLVRPGHSISKADNDREHGTIGVIMEARNLSPAPNALDTTYVALACAHVSKVSTVVYAKDSRKNQPFKMHENPFTPLSSTVRSFQRECAFLWVPERDMAQFSLGFYEYVHQGPLDPHLLKNVRLDCHYFNSDSSHGFAFDPTSASRSDFIEQAMLDGPVIVYKQGATTGYTEGILVAIQDDLAPHCSHAEIRGLPLNSLDRHHYEWIGLVRLDSTRKPFTKRGDSGSLVFACSGRAIIPLGIHIASSEAEEETSVFVSLDAFCLQARCREGFALSFPNRNIPWWVELLALSRGKLDRSKHVSLQKSDPIRWAARTRQTSMFESVISDKSTECTSEDPYGRTLMSYLTEMNEYKLVNQLSLRIQALKPLNHLRRPSEWLRAACILSETACR
jgi:hypothetical protein